jgi:hypothetical protein
MEGIITELLITLVEERPAIWDKTLDCYKDKKLKESAWRGTCVILAHHCVMGPPTRPVAYNRV